MRVKGFSILLSTIPPVCTKLHIIMSLMHNSPICLSEKSMIGWKINVTLNNEETKTELYSTWCHVKMTISFCMLWRCKRERVVWQARAFCFGMLAKGYDSLFSPKFTYKLSINAVVTVYSRPKIECAREVKTRQRNHLLVTSLTSQFAQVVQKLSYF